MYVSILANPKLSKWDPDAKVEPWVASDDWKTKGEAYQSIWVDATE